MSNDIAVAIPKGQFVNAAGHHLIPFQVFVPAQSEIVPAFFRHRCRPVTVDDKDVEEVLLVKLQDGTLEMVVYDGTMIICIADVLTREELEEVRSLLQSALFVDGKSTAGWHARLVKHNQQVQSNDPALLDVRSRIQTALQQHPVFQMAALPRAIAPLLLSRYEPGMSYGTHVDNAYMGNAKGETAGMRSDLSMTLFLSKPDDYEGGELIIESSQGEQPFKLAAGSLILYPSTTLHRVETVTSGIRLAAVTWIQSLVRDASEREILFDLETARQAIFAESGKTPAFDLLSKSYANLLRKWGD